MLINPVLVPTAACCFCKFTALKIIFPLNIYFLTLVLMTKRNVTRLHYERLIIFNDIKKVLTFVGVTMTLWHKFSQDHSKVLLKAWMNKPHAFFLDCFFLLLFSHRSSKYKQSQSSSLKLYKVMNFIYCIHIERIAGFHG